MAPGSSGSPRRASRQDPPSRFGRLCQRNVKGTKAMGRVCSRCSSMSAGNGSDSVVTADGSVRGARKNTIAASPRRTASSTRATSPLSRARIWCPPRYQRANGEKIRYPSPVAALASGSRCFQNVQLK